MRKCLQSGGFYYFYALDSPEGMFNLFGQHTEPIFVSSQPESSNFSEIVSEYWVADTKEAIASKLQDKEYEKMLAILKTVKFSIAA